MGKLLEKKEEEGGGGIGERGEGNREMLRILIPFLSFYLKICFFLGPLIWIIIPKKQQGFMEMLFLPLLLLVD